MGGASREAVVIILSHFFSKLQVLLLSLPTLLKAACTNMHRSMQTFEFVCIDMHTHTYKTRIRADFLICSEVKK